MGKFQKQLKEFLKEQVEYFVSCQKEYGHGTFADEHLERVTTKFFDEAIDDFPDIGKVSIVEGKTKEAMHKNFEAYWKFVGRVHSWKKKWLDDSE